MRLLKAWEQEREPYWNDHEAEPARELERRDVSPTLEDVDSEQRQGGIDERVHQEDGPEPEDEHGDEVCASYLSGPEVEDEAREARDGEVEQDGGEQEPRRVGAGEEVERTEEGGEP